MKQYTETGRSWLQVGSAGLRPDQAQELAKAARRIADRRGSPRIGGNHVLAAMVSTRLYQRGAVASRV